MIPKNTNTAGEANGMRVANTEILKLATASEASGRHWSREKMRSQYPISINNDVNNKNSFLRKLQKALTGGTQRPD